MACVARVGGRCVAPDAARLASLVRGAQKEPMVAQGWRL